MDIESGDLMAANHILSMLQTIYSPAFRSRSVVFENLSTSIAFRYVDSQENEL